MLHTHTQNLEATVSQAEAFAEIRKMKHVMTSRVPQLHNRTLSGNIFDQSLGVLHDRSTSELLDSEHAHLEIIGKEVSIWQEDSAENTDTRLPDSEGEGRGDEDHTSGDSDSGVGSGEAKTSSEGDKGAVASPEKFMDDAPGIGMEVVCEEGVDPFVSNDVIEGSSVPLHNGVVNGLTMGSPADIALADLHQRSAVEHREKKSAVAEDTEGDMHHKILRLFQDARYDLRFPVRRYSNQASRAKANKTPPAQSSETPEEHFSPSPGSTRKRGRSRKKASPPQSTSQLSKRGQPL
jgi:hypothetical protein